VRNDEITVGEIRRLNPTQIIISPGLGKPSEAGICIKVVKQLHKQFPILGVCLGHQAIFEAFGGTVSYASQLMHGKSSVIEVDSDNPLFKGIQNPTGGVQVARYHSLAGIESTLPKKLKVIARTLANQNGSAVAGEGVWGEAPFQSEIMAICHKDFPVYGVQFHPESILTPKGQIIIENFLRSQKNGLYDRIAEKT
jgi:anthranilate synthase component 2